MREIKITEVERKGVSITEVFGNQKLLYVVTEDKKFLVTDPYGVMETVTFPKYDTALMYAVNIVTKRG